MIQLRITLLASILVATAAVSGFMCAIAGAKRGMDIGIKMGKQQIINELSKKLRITI